MKLGLFQPSWEKQVGKTDTIYRKAEEGTGTPY